MTLRLSASRSLRLLTLLLLLGSLLILSGPASAQENFAAKTGSFQGVVTATIRGDEGTITVFATNDWWAGGGTYTGEVLVEPAGKTDAERSKNLKKLSRKTLQIANQIIPVGEKYYTVTLPSTLSNAEKAVTLRGGKGNPLATTPLPIQSRPSAIATPATLQCQKFVQTGRPMQWTGPINPDLKTTVAKVGDQQVTLRAASSRKLVGDCPSKLKGRQKWVVNQSTGETQVIDVSLSGNTKAVQKGGQVIVHLTVTGAEDSDEELPIEVDVTTPETVRMSGGDHRILFVPPRQGVFTQDLILTGLNAGVFGLTANLKTSASDQAVGNAAKGLEPEESKKPQTAHQLPKDTEICTFSCAAYVAKDEKVYCVDAGGCTNLGCHCNCYKAKKKKPDETKEPEWEKIGGPFPSTYEYEKDDYDYHCFCTK